MWENRQFLKNWRPISLLDKIIAKLVATTLQTVIHSIINDDQSGYLKGRYISQNIRILEDIPFFSQNNKLPSVLLSIDFEKALILSNGIFLLKTLNHVSLAGLS